MTIVNHYGIWVDSETPVNGVYSTNDINWEFLDDFCLDCEETYEAIDKEHEENGGSGEEDEYRDYDSVECDSSHMKLIGDYKKDENGKYVEDKDGEFFAVINEFTVHVLWSKFTTRGALCSPCCAGQVSADESGEFLCYALPEYLIYKDGE